MDISYINRVKNDLRKYLFGAVESRSNPIDGPYYYIFIRLNYLIKYLYSSIVNNKVPIDFNQKVIEKTEILIISKHYALDFEALENYNQNITIVGYKEEYELAKNKKWGFINAIKIYQCLGKTNWKDKNLSENLLNSITDYNFKIKSLLKLKTVYINSDLLPFYRATLMVFAELPLVKIICPQHGLYTSIKRQGETEGALADINIVFDEIQKKFLINSGIRAETIIIKDYKLTEQIFSSKKNYCKRPKDVIIVAEGWHIILGFTVFKYYKYLYNIWKTLKINGYTPILRPHPSEKYLFKLLFFIEKDLLPLDDSLNTYENFVSSGSSVLRQAKMRGKLAIQLNQTFYNNIIDMSAVGYANYKVEICDLAKILNGKDVVA